MHLRLLTTIITYKPYNNPYGYPYNPIGFEHAVLQSFHLDLFSRKTVLNNINEQFKFWDSKEKKMVSVDSNTSNADYMK